MKLQLKHIAPYLPYGLEFVCICPKSMEYEISQVSNIHIGNEIIEVGATEFEFSDLGGEEIKPILRPLSDLTKEIEHNDRKFIPIKMFARSSQRDVGEIVFQIKSLEILDHYIFQYLIEWHFDVFGLIEKGLAIDKNSI